MATKLKDNVKIGTQMYEQYQVVAKDGLIAIAKAYLIAHGTPNPSATQITAQENKYKRYAKRDGNKKLVDPPNGTYDKTTVAEIKAKGSIYTGEILLLPYTADVIPPVVTTPDPHVVPTTTTSQSPLDILNLRLAKGEIDLTQYQDIKKALGLK